MSDPAEATEQKPWMSSGRSLHWRPAERMPLDLFSYTREAVHCLDRGRFLAAISMASTAVELILNRDGRMKRLTEIAQATHGWLKLNNRTLRVARKNILPTHALLSEGDDLDSTRPISFVDLRNKIAHGEIAHLVTTLSDHDPSAERLACEQVRKMRRFVSEWFNTAPDVQEGRIRNHRWPDPA
jgi:hypothetical protein